jgi:prephenate dehydrogenase
MKIAIMGVGGMGSWLAKELSRSHEVAIYDSNSNRMKAVRNVHHLGHFKELRSFGPQFLFNAVSLQNTVVAFEAASPFLGQDCFIADIASIKGKIPEYYRKSPFRFVSCHPMFGPKFANWNQLENENLIIISESDSEGKKFIWNFFGKFKLNFFECSFLEHDELMSYSLTLPFASSIVFSACLTSKVVPGTTFQRHKEIACKLLEEDDFLLAEVLFNPHSLKQLEKICSRLEFLKHIIRARDHEEARKLFAGLRINLKK